MGMKAFIDIPVFYDGYSIATDLSEIELMLMRATPDKTSLADQNRRYAGGGLPSNSTKHSGYLDPADNNIDAILQASLGVDGKVLTICPTGSAEGELAYSVKVMTGGYRQAGQIGGMQGISGSFANQGEREIRGNLLLVDAVSESTDGTTYQLGAVGADEYLRAALHVVAISGAAPSVTVKVQSDDAEAFTDPIDRITFTAASAIGAQWATPVAGAILDDWWRATITFGGTTSAFTAILNVGIF